MKRIITIALALLMCISFAACKKDGEGTETTKPNNSQSYDDLKYKSDLRLTDEELFTFPHKDGELTAALGSMISISEDGNGLSMPFTGDEYDTYLELKTPFGITAGDTAKELCDSFKLDTGYAAYIEKGKSFVMYDKADGISFSGNEGGCIYFGYAKDNMGKWAFMDYEMITQLLQGQILMQSENDYNVVVYAFVFDNEENITTITTLYGEINDVMSIIAIGSGATK